MQVRKNRSHYCGFSNKDVRVSLNDLGSTYQRGPAPNADALQKLSNPRPQNFSELVHKKLSLQQFTPQHTTKTFYQSNEKPLRTEADVCKPRDQQLQKIGKRIFNGDSNVILDSRINSDYKFQKPSIFLEQKELQNNDEVYRKNMIQQKYDNNALAPTETQLVNFAKYNTVTQQDKVNISKVREIKRALRRRYANQTNLYKMFQAWDKEQKGFITAQNAFDMMNKMGINCNLAEAQTLIASADKNFSGSLNLNEFLDMVYNINDALNTNPPELSTMGITESPHGNKGNSSEIIKYLQCDANTSKELARKNQINLMLKHQLDKLSLFCKKADQDKKGLIDQENMKNGFKELGINEELFKNNDKDELIKKYNDETTNQFKYQEFLKDLNDFQYNPTNFYQQQIQHPAKRFTQEEMNKQLSVYQDLTPQQLQQFKPLNYQSFTQSSLINKTARKVFHKLRLNNITKQDLEQHLQSQLQASSLENQAVSHKALNNAFEQLFKEKQIGVEPGEMKALMSYFDYNEAGFTNAENISNLLFTENEKDFYIRKSNQSRRGPPILSNSTINMYSTAPASQGAEKQMSQSQIDFKQPQLQSLLNKFDSRVYQGDNNSLNVFRQFDFDGDGYISQKDINNKLDQLALFNSDERKQFMNYIGLENEKYLTYPEFVKKIKPNMGNVAPDGQIITVPYNQSSKEEHQKLLNVIPSSTQSFLELRKNFLPESCKFQGKTRFGATPIHKNTFVNFQVPESTGGYASSQERFHIQPLSKIQFQIDEKEKLLRMQNNKISKYYNDRQNYFNKLETEERFRELKLANKLQAKGLAQWGYEHQCHLFQALK